MTETQRAAMQKALEALENCNSTYGHRCNRCDSEVDEGGKVATALRAALAEPAPEPIGQVVCIDYSSDGGPELVVEATEEIELGTFLYTAPPARRPLTDEEIDEATAQAADALLDHIYEYGTTAEGVRQRIRKLARAVERKITGGNDE